MEKQLSDTRYTGPDRRTNAERRNKPDRRVSIRWEPDRDDRRRNVDRRRERAGSWSGTFNR